MIIKTKLSEKDFIDASLATIWARKFSKLFLIVFLLILASNIYNATFTKGSIIPIILPVLIIFGGIFLVTRYRLKKTYQKNYRSSENIEYNFTDSWLQITGESFTSEMSWNKVYKVTKTKKWLLIWQSSQIANAIPLRLISTVDLQQLREIMQKNHTKYNL